MQKRRFLFGANVVFASLLALALLGIVNYLASRYYRRFDWTRHRLNSLDEKTLNLLMGVGERKLKVKAVSFFAPDPRQPWQAELQT